VKKLAACEQLGVLNLSRCKQVTDEGVKALAACKRLRHLDVQGCDKVTAAAEAHLRAALPELTVMRLVDEPIRKE